MNHRVGRFTTVLVLLAASVSGGCLFGGSYKMKISPSGTGSVASQVQSLYIIVGPKEELAEPLLTKSRYKDLLEEDRIGKYTSFVQYQPVEPKTADEPRWKLLFAGTPSEYVEHEVDEDSIKVKIGHDLIKKSGGKEFSLVVLSQLGNGTFEQVTVHHASLNDKAKQVVTVSGGSLQLLDV